MGSFIRADLIIKGDILFMFDGNKEEVKTIEYLDDTASVNVYDITVDGNHNYFASKLLVHNKCGEYKGSDEAERNRIEADKAAWVSTQAAITLEDEKIKNAIRKAGEQKIQFGQQRTLESKQAAIENLAATNQANIATGEAKVAAGMTNLAFSSESNKLIEDAQGTFEGIQETAAISSEARRLDYVGSENSLIDAVRDTAMSAASNKANLYASYVGGMASPYSNVPKAPETSGMDWDFGEEFTGSGGSEFISSKGKSGFGFGVGSCLLGDTSILTSNGISKNIKNLKLGDIVKTYDVTLKKIDKNKITKVMKHIVNKFIIINNKLKVTGNHLIYIIKNN